VEGRGGAEEGMEFEGRGVECEEVIQWEGGERKRGKRGYGGGGGEWLRRGDRVEEGGEEVGVAWRWRGRGRMGSVCKRGWGVRGVGRGGGEGMWSGGGPERGGGGADVTGGDGQTL